MWLGRATYVGKGHTPTGVVDGDRRQGPSTGTVDGGRRRGSSTGTVDGDHRRGPSTGTVDVVIAQQGESHLATAQPTTIAPPYPMTKRNAVDDEEYVHVGDESTHASKLRVVVVLDVTGSMSPYLSKCQEAIESLIANLAQEVERDVKMGIVVFRDFKSQDPTFVTQHTPFHSLDKSVELTTFLKGKSASGGGDTPEAVNEGLHVAFEKYDWPTNGANVVVLIGDAPPHGLGEPNDGIPQGEGIDPFLVLDLANQRHISVYTAACATSSQHGDSYFAECARRTGGKAIKLSSAEDLPNLVLGAGIERVGDDDIIERLVGEVAALKTTNTEESDEWIMAAAEEAVYRSLSSRGTTTRVMQYRSLDPPPPSFVGANSLGAYTSAAKEERSAMSGATADVARMYPRSGWSAPRRAPAEADTYDDADFPVYRSLTSAVHATSAYDDDFPVYRSLSSTRDTAPTAPCPLLKGAPSITIMKRKIERADVQRAMSSLATRAISGMPARIA